MTVLVGRNGAGKTNILRAIDFAARSAVAQKFDDAPGVFRDRTAPARVRLQFKLAEGEFRYSLTFTAHRGVIAARQPPIAHESLETNAGDILQGSAWRPIITREAETVRRSDRHAEAIQIAAAAPCLTAVAALLPQDDPLLKTIQPVMSFLNSIHYYPLDELNLLAPQGFASQIIRHTDYVQWLQTKNAGASSSVLMRLIHMSQEMPDEYMQLKELLGDNGLGILYDMSVETLSLGVGTHKPNPDEKSDLIYFVQFFPTQSPRGELRTYDQISFGTRRLLRVLASMLHDKSLVTLIEQPEDGIHPGLLHKLIPMLKSNADVGQVIMASHSPAIFNRLSPDEIRLVQMRKGGTEIRALSKAELDGAEHFISEEGPLADFIEGIEED